MRRRSLGGGVSFLTLPRAEGAARPPARFPPRVIPAEAFSFDNVVKKAEELATRPFENPDGAVPDFLLNISYDQWRKIRFRPNMSLWRNEKLPFEAQFFHPGLFYNRLVGINIVHDGGGLTSFSTNFFEYGTTLRVENGSVPLTTDSGCTSPETGRL